MRDGDIVTIDVEKRRIDMDVSDVELKLRRTEWVAPPLKAIRGTLYKVWLLTLCCAPYVGENSRNEGILLMRQQC